MSVQPSQIPNSVADVFSNFIASEFAYFTPKGAPLCWPVTPYWYPKIPGLAIATGLAYPKKADYPKLNPKVALYFSDPTASGIGGDIKVLVQGNARVQDEDIQGNTDRYIRELRDKFVVARFGLNRWSVKLLDFYLPRLWVDIAPMRITIEEVGRGAAVIGELDNQQGGDQLAGSASAGSAGLAKAEIKALREQVHRFGEGVVTTRGAQGYPSMFRSDLICETDGSITIPRVDDHGPACITMHHHRLRGTHFQAYMVRGYVAAEDLTRFIPERLVGFFGNGTIFPLSVLPKVGMLRGRLRKELAIRHQEMPSLRIP